jgi:cellulose synthase/poly-beta-1,6-N-acetylglucosamine synthase-like glycosyltransferase
VDEATIEVLLRLIGYSVVYAPLSIVYNRGPKNFKEFLTQRRRVQTGHQWVKTTYNYQVSTMRLSNIAEAILAILVKQPSKVWPLVRLVCMETIALGLGYIDFYILEKNPYRWKMISR